MLKKSILLFTAATGLVLAQDRTLQVTRTPFVFTQPEDKVLPRIIAGGNWETVIVLLNMSSSITMKFNLNFYDTAGVPLPLTFVTFPDNRTITDVGASAQLAPGGSFNFSLVKDGPQRVGWAVLTYDSALGRIGGNAVLRQYNANNVPGAIFEGVVPLSNSQDYKFFMPFDNFQGFSTAIALTNTGNVINHTTLTFLDSFGVQIFQDVITLPAGNHIAFSIPDRYPRLAGRFGTIYAQADTIFLAGLGLRFNPSGPFTSVPILNWAGMFP